MMPPPPLSAYLGPLFLQFSETLESFTRATLWEFLSITAWLDAMEADGYQSPAEEAARAQWLAAYTARDAAGRRLLSDTRVLVALTNLNPRPALA
ncbi:hypothetical protein [Vitiosangium sp. GDMCC 1.1324]|uniref:hypothetical protein n=1 Tax=Vitiosangium sp. (strain GDMCC 1.1324) TaxID=2138576 RepID=UPI0011B3BE04|nr:hypothetical protein [Vitiosangium sp. GDMCC 1.1324]